MGNVDEDLNQVLRELDVPETVGEESSSFVAPQPDGADLIARLLCASVLCACIWGTVPVSRILPVRAFLLGIQANKAKVESCH